VAEDEDSHVTSSFVVYNIRQSYTMIKSTRMSWAGDVTLIRV